MSSGLTPCRQLRPSSRREHVRASNSQIGWEKNKNKKRTHSKYQTTHKNLYSAAAFKNSKITSGLTPRRRARSTRAGDFIGNSFILYPSLPVPPLDFFIPLSQSLHYSVPTPPSQSLPSCQSVPVSPSLSLPPSPPLPPSLPVPPPS